MIICDDVEVPKTCDTADKRADLRERLAEIDFVMAPGGTQLYVGTPHSWYTIYAAEARTEVGEDAPFLHGFTRLSVPICDEAGVSVWPERFPAEEIVALKRRSGPNRFASQMLLRPVNVADGRLDPALLQKYEAKLRLDKIAGGLFIGDVRMVSCSAYWDPSFGRGGDASVLAVVFTDVDGEYWLQKLEYITADKFSADDEATQQCRKVSFTAQLLCVPMVAVEGNGIGKFLPAVLRREIAKRRAPCAVREVSNNRPKDMRIMESLDAVMAAKALHVHESVYQTPFIREMQEWAPGRKGGNDDGLDAVAGALAMAPVRIKNDGFMGRQGWQRGGNIHSARSDFDV